MTVVHTVRVFFPIAAGNAQHTGIQLYNVDTLADGKWELQDELGKRVGTYDPNTNETHDRAGRLIDAANLLETFDFK